MGSVDLFRRRPALELPPSDGHGVPHGHSRAAPADWLHLVAPSGGLVEIHLEPANFLRIHRSHLINLEYVTSIEPYDANRVEVIMKSGTRIVASRTGSKRLRDLAL